MNASVYRAGIRLINLAAQIKPLAAALTGLSRAWLRHATLRAILAENHFDGVIDGGANVGEFAAIVRSVLPNSDLVCVEPHPQCAATLRAQGYRVVEAALWRTETILTLSQPAPETTSCTVLESASARSTWKVSAVTLNGLPIKGERVLVKLDLQGAEAIALEGMGDLWGRCRGVIAEVSLGENGSYDALADILRARGFREAATINQVRLSEGRWEADKLWIRR